MNGQPIFTLIKNVRLTTAHGTSELCSILFRNRSADQRSQILEIGKVRPPDKSAGKCWVVDGKFNNASLGFTDLSVHVCEPGEIRRESLKQTSGAALSGGVTSLYAIHDVSVKLQLTPDDIVNYINTYSEKLPCRFIPASRAGSDGVAPANAHPVYLAAPYSEEALFSAMESCAKIGRTVIVKCVGPYNGGWMYDGSASALFRTKNTIPRHKCDIAASSALIIAARTGCRLHLSAVSTSSELEMIRIAKARGVRVTCDTCPQYFTFTENDLFMIGTSLKLMPPLSTQADKEAVIEGICDGTIDCIASDHTPCDTKKRGNSTFDQAEFGMIGLQTLFPASYTALVAPGHIPLERLIEMLSSAPARVLGFEDSLRVGGQADITIFSTDKKGVLSEKDIRGGQTNSPFVGSYYLSGSIIDCFADGANR